MEVNYADLLFSSSFVTGLHVIAAIVVAVAAFGLVDTFSTRR